MGSAKVSIAKPQTMENKTFKPISILKSFFHKDKKKEKAREREIIDKKERDEAETKEKREHKQKPENTVASILESFQKLEIKNELLKEEDESSNFTFKVIEEDRRSSRIDSQSSQDSGFADLHETLDNLTLNEKDAESGDKSDTEKKEKDEETKETKKKKRVVIKRGPLRTKVTELSSHPYQNDCNKPISQINKQTLSGGQVIVNTDSSELDVALQSVAKFYHSDPNYWNDVLDIISSDSQTDILSSFPQIEPETAQFHSINIVPEKSQTPNPIEEFTALQHLPSYEDSVDFNILGDNLLGADVFPTPPRSDVPSPLSESQTFYASNSDYTLSPERSSPYNIDFERYQEISPHSYDEFHDSKRESENASQMSISSMTMKNFKDMQKEITNEFSKKECCDINRRTTKELFEEHLKKLKSADRANLCFKASKLDIKTAYGVLQNILLSLSKEEDRVDLQYSLFALLCMRVLAQSPKLFVGDFGLSILKAAALRCPHRPLLTRHIVHCVYLALRQDPKLCSNECVFHEVDAQGDNLVIACARGGDAYALVLAEITRSDVRGELPPLFRLHHANSDGYTALHVACRQHSASNSHLHIVHALLDHAHADLWKGDIKGGDTALHLAVNSSTCCLRLVLTLFKHEDRKLWKKLAHAQNMSSVTPLEYARSASKSTTRQNYPHEVLDFLKKCR